MNRTTITKRVNCGGLRHLGAIGLFSLGLTAPWAGAQVCAWEALDGGGIDPARLYALTVFDGDLHAGGTFRESLGAPSSFIARWSGGEWHPLGPSVGGVVFSLLEFDDGRGPSLFVGGGFGRAGDIPDANGVARWDGSEWTALGVGLRNDDPRYPYLADAFAVFDDGSGSALYVGGSFTHAGGIPATNIARWDGREWSAVGEGLEGHPGIRALAVYDDGSGPALYAGGYLTDGLSRWDGNSWEIIDRDVGAVNALVVFDDGTGPGLYAGGQFWTAGGQPAARVARYDGAWSPLGSGTSFDVHSFHVFDDGRGPALYVGGGFAYAGGVEVWGIARWDGREWSDPGGGLYGDGRYSVDAMVTFDDGSGPALYAGGIFTHAGGETGVPVDNIARYRCDSPCYADCDGDGELTFFDFLCFQNEFAAQTPYADCDGSGSHDFFDFLCFQNAFAEGCR